MNKIIYVKAVKDDGFPASVFITGDDIHVWSDDRYLYVNATGESEGWFLDRRDAFLLRRVREIRRLK